LVTPLITHFRARVHPIRELVKPSKIHNKELISVTNNCMHNIAYWLQANQTNNPFIAWLLHCCQQNIWKYHLIFNS